MTDSDQQQGREGGEGAAQLIINQNQNTLKAPKNTFYNLDKHI